MNALKRIQMRERERENEFLKDPIIASLYLVKKVFLESAVNHFIEKT